MGASWLHWGFSLMFSAMLVREIARRMEGVDYRALAAIGASVEGKIAMARYGRCYRGIKTKLAE